MSARVEWPGWRGRAVAPTYDSHGITASPEEDCACVEWHARYGPDCLTRPWVSGSTSAVRVTHGVRWLLAANDTAEPCAPAWFNALVGRYGQEVTQPVQRGGWPASVPEEDDGFQPAVGDGCAVLVVDDGDDVPFCSGACQRWAANLATQRDLPPPSELTYDEWQGEIHRRLALTAVTSGDDYFDRLVTRARGPITAAELRARGVRL